MFESELIKLEKEYIALGMDDYLNSELSDYNLEDRLFYLSEILRNIDVAVGIEINVWKPYKKVFLTGHIDLVLLHDGTLIIVDYKPDESAREGHFLRSIPQLACYALLLEEEFGIKKVLCIAFNKDGAWIYHPSILLTEIKEYLISINYNNRFWEKYFI